MNFQAPRGTVDILPEDQPYWRLVESKVRQIASSFGYSQIDTPLFEDTRLFTRGVGESTDIVEKETYTFLDRGGDSLTLRPEGTAPVCRAYLEHGMHNLPQPVRLYYMVPNFRYERPQSGRFRAFHQFGIEAFGESDPYIDSEVIEVSWRFLEEVGLKELILKVNSIGDSSCRPSYIKALRGYYKDVNVKLCEDCIRRLNTNPLRLLDCKISSCQPLIEKAPKSVDHLCGDCEEHWHKLQDHLRVVGISFEVDNKLVRGLDYYTRTVYEISPPMQGQTSVITGGGRYDGLIEQLGGPPTPGIGFGMGLERVIENLKHQNIIPHNANPSVTLVAHIGDQARMEAVKIASQIRQSGGSAIIGPSRGLRSQLRYASSVEASHVVIIGEDELAKGKYVLRNLGDSEQKDGTPEEIIRELSAGS